MNYLQYVLNNEESIDAQTLEQTKAEFIEEVVDEFADKLTRLAYTYVKDWGNAEDIVQEVFVTCFAKIDTFRGDCSLKNWLYKITVNRCKDYLKSWAFKNIMIGNSFLKTKKAYDKSPELTLIVEGEYKELADSILSLPVKYREVVILFYQEELPIDGISLMLQTKPSTIKSRLHRARQMLKKKLS